MIKALLRQNDGLSRGRIWLGSVVKNAQLGLVQAGHPMTADGKFGSGTAGAVKAFQRNHDVAETGAVDRSTWTALEDDLEAATGAEAARVAQILDQFQGDLDWVHAKEGHRGRPYWPGGASGVTLDPGVDLGHASASLIEQLYGPLVDDAQMEALRGVFGIQREPARAALEASPVIQGIRISSEQALEVMPNAAKTYWEAIRDRFGALVRKDTPPSVQTVLLSLAYNRGARNPGLDVLRQPLEAKQWSEVARAIGAMQQDHELAGIRTRRQQEGLLVEAEVEFLAS